MVKFFFVSCFVCFVVFGCTKPSESPPPQDSTGTLLTSGNSCSEILLFGKYQQDTLTNSSNKLRVKLNVSKPGNFSIYSDTVNGVYFTGTGNFSAPGLDSVDLSCFGTPIMGGQHIYKLNFGTSTCSFSINTIGNDDSTLVYLAAQRNFESYLYCLQGQTGQIKFRAKTPARPYIGQLAAIDSFIYLSCEDQAVYALHAKTGNIHWRFSTDVYAGYADIVSNGITINGSRLYFSCGGAKVFCIDTTTYIGYDRIRTPRVKWTYWFGNGESDGTSPQMVKNGHVYFGRYNYMYSLDELSGVLRWKSPGGGGVYTRPTMNESTIFTAAENVDTLRAFNSNTGVEKWKTRMNSSSNVAIVKNGIVYAGPSAYNADNGFLIWDISSQVNNPSVPNPAVSTPVIDNGVGYTIVDYRWGFPCALFAFEAATGKVKWKYNIIDDGGKGTHPPIVVNKVIYLTTVSGVAIAIDGLTGNQIWKTYISVSDRDEIHNSPLVIGKSGKIYTNSSTE